MLGLDGHAIDNFNQRNLNGKDYYNVDATSLCTMQSMPHPQRIFTTTWYSSDPPMLHPHSSNTLP
jgi:hypothetical protein